jgi:hypothetical protein
MKQLAIILICLFAANANALTKEQIEEKFNLPPEPNVELNNSTIEGVDSNGIRGRDDVERKLAFEFYENEESLNELFKLSQDLQYLTTLSLEIKTENTSKKEFSELFEKVLQTQACSIMTKGKAYVANVNYLRTLIYNNDDRYLNYYVSEGYAPSAKSDISKCK